MTANIQTISSRVEAGSSYPAVTRLDTLDLLRGLCALAVAVFHYHSWGGLYAPRETSGFLALCGTYGVSIFFVLSGFSLSHAYRAKFAGGVTAADALRYARRRIGRLAPLFASVVAASIAGRLIFGGHVPSIVEIAANLLLLFGFVDPAATPVVGGWSIGIEVVFYVLFPLMLVLREKWAVIIAASALMTLWVSLNVAAHTTLSAGWGGYVNPANHLLFFAGGVYTALIPRQVRLPAWLSPAILIALSLAGMAALSYDATELQVVVGVRRAMLIPLSILLVWSLSRVEMGRFKLFAALLGGASYPLYLIHPLLYFLFARYVTGAPVLALLLLAGAVFAAIVTDYAIDKPLQRRVKAAGW